MQPQAPVPVPTDGTDRVSIQQGAYDALRAATLGAGLRSDIATNYFAPERSADLAQGNARISKAEADWQADEQERIRKNAAAAAAASGSGSSGSGKFERVAKEDGGFAFYDPDGNEISAWQYSRAQGKDPTYAVKGSQNPIDQGFSQDYKNLQSFLTAVRNGDKKTVKAYYKANPKLKKYEKNVQKLTQDFQKRYPTVFGTRGSGRQSPWSVSIKKPSKGGGSLSSSYGL